MKKISRGNKTVIPPDADIVPRFLTNTITTKKPTNERELVRPIPENVPFAKCDVDENHK